MVLMLIAAGTACLAYFGVTQKLSFLAAEARFELLKRDPTGEIVVVDIDSRSLSEVAVWPWPRSLHANLIDHLTQAGASQIAFDVDFSSTSTEENDAALEAALERSGGIVSLATFEQMSGHSQDGVSELIVNQPLERFLQYAWPVVISVPLEKDDNVWRNLLGQEIAGILEFSLSAVIAEYPEASAEGFWVDFGIDAKKIPVYSYVDVMSGTVPATSFQDKRVIVGASAQELHDLFPTPVYGYMPGSVIQAMGAESLLQGRALEWKGTWVLTGLVILLVLPLLFFVDSCWRLRLILGIALAACLELGAIALQAYQPILLDTGPAFVVILLAAINLVWRQIGFGQFMLSIANARNRNNEKMLSQVFKDSFDAIVVVDEAERVVSASRKAQELFPNGLDAGSLAKTYLPGEICQELEKGLAEDPALYRPSLKLLKIEDEDGRIRHLEYVVNVSNMQAISDERGSQGEATRMATITCRDVTLQREATDKLAYLAKYESLTGLLNRSSFMNALSDELVAIGQRRENCVLAMFTLRDMEQITTSLGFTIGDKLRQEIAERLSDGLVAGQLAAMIGDDKFAFFGQFDGDEEAVLERLHAISAALSEEYEFNGARVQAFVFTGYTILPVEQASPEVMLRQAANALSLALTDPALKCVRFDEAIEARMQRRQYLEVELSHAIERDEMFVVYQPQVDLKTGETVGVEALVRWQHPELGFISPEEFITIAEESGRIHDIGAWVMRRALQEASEWPRQIRLAVNVSAQQIVIGDLHEIVAEALEEFRFPADHLDLELTESLFIDESVDLDTPINAALSLGCSLAMDDFGTGYSGLGYLTRFPFSKIKLDKSFVSDVDENTGHQAIVAATVDLAKAYRMTMVVEGVETAEQAVMLADLGAHIGQGYYYSRPVEAKQIEQMLQTRAA